MLFNEPKLLKCNIAPILAPQPVRFSALQRAEIAEMFRAWLVIRRVVRFSALQRAEIAEMRNLLDDFSRL